MKGLMLASLILPVVAALLIKFVHTDIRIKRNFLILVLMAECVLTVCMVTSEPVRFMLFSMSDILRVEMEIDNLSKLFMVIASFGFLFAGIFASKYMEHEHDAFPEENFYLFFLLSLFGLMGMDMSCNLVSMYFFFEMITLLSMPLVLHEKSKELD